jgi:hypothetical protein
MLMPGLLRAQGFREEGPIEIEKCQTLNQPGSYKLVRNLSAPSGAKNCLVVGADFVTIDLAGFTISGTTSPQFTFGVTIDGFVVQGVAVRNGTISGFNDAVDLDGASGSVVEGLRVFCGSGGGGITAVGIVKGNTLTNCAVGINAGGRISGNTVVGDTTGNGINVNQGSTVIANTVTNNRIGINSNCPANLIDNTAFNNGTNLVLIAQPETCNLSNNVAP